MWFSRYSDLRKALANEEPGIDSRKGKRIFVFYKTSKLYMSPPTFLFNK
jgi:hypothetical protein